MNGFPTSFRPGASLVRFLLLATLLLPVRAEVPAGAWSGKPWNESELEKAVEKGVPEGLAELAYWKHVGWLGRKYEPAAIAELGRRSAEQGNPYGQAIFSQCLAAGLGVEKDGKRALQLAKQSAGAGHPLGLKNLANLEHGIDGDNAKWKERTVKAAEAGCVMSESNLSKCHLLGLNGFAINKPLAYRMAAKAVERDRACYYSMAQSVVFPGEEAAAEFGATKEIFASAVARLEMAAAAGIAEPTSVLARHLIKTGNPERGVPMLIQAAESGHSYATQMLLEYTMVPALRKEAGIASQFSTVYRLARRAYEQGDRNHNVVAGAGASYIFNAFPGEKVNPRKAIEIGREIQAKGLNCWHVNQFLGMAYFSDISGDLLDQRRGEAHYILASRTHPSDMGMRLAFTYWTVADRKKFGPHAYAAAISVKEYYGPATPIGKLTKEIHGKLTPEEMKVAEDLIEKDFPKADEFRQQALETLIEYGDYPKGTSLEKAGRPCH